MDRKARQLEGIRRRQAAGENFGRPPKADRLAVVKRLEELAEPVSVDDAHGLYSVLQSVAQEFGISVCTARKYIRKVNPPENKSKRRLGCVVFALCEHFFGRMAAYGPTDTNWRRWFRSGRTQKDWGVFGRHPITKRIRVEVAALFGVSLRKVPGYSQEYAHEEQVQQGYLDWIDNEIEAYLVEREALRRFGANRRKEFLAAKAASYSPTKRMPFELEIRDWSWLDSLGIGTIDIDDLAEEASKRFRPALSNFEGLDQVAKGNPRR